ncbi:MAG: acyloxyacyl hydrolase [Chitinophagales bacterium]|nr:acyloxyacyl hydrolase [Chitinophagales bacterium]
MRYLVLCLSFCVLLNHHAHAQYSAGDTWYQNPLGFSPLNLHTSMGFFLPAVAVGACLIFTKKDTSLHRKFSVYNETGFSWGYKYPFTFLPQNNTGVNFQLRRWMAVGAELDFYFPKDGFNNNTAGIAIRPYARFFPVNRERWRLYFESGGGLALFYNQFPQPTDKDGRLGTRLNGTTKYGLGAEFNFSPNAAIVFGVRHLHVSNGNTKGVDRNPSHDSNGFFIGAAFWPK